MKKLIAVLVVICVFFAGALSYKLYDENRPGDVEAADEEVITVGDSTEGAEGGNAPAGSMSYQSIDKDRLYALYAPETVVATVDGEAVPWDEYFYWIVSNGSQVENYFASMAAYGMAPNWTDPVSADAPETYIDFVIQTTDECVKEAHSVMNFASRNGITLTQEDEAKVAEILASDMLNYCGENATDADFDAFLAEMYMPRSVYNMMNRMNLLYQQGYNTLFGENGSKVTDAEAMGYLEENGYMCANHILFMTIDPATGAALEEDAVKAQLAKAEELVINLRAYEDNEELVKRFEELKAEMCEDTGKTAYPSGYTFTPGTMVPEFEDSCMALADYQVSDPVLTSYGYHVIIRLPLSVDAAIDFSAAGTPLTARSYYANTKYGELMQEQLDNTVFSYAEGFEGIDLQDYLV